MRHIRFGKTLRGVTVAVCFGAIALSALYFSLIAKVALGIFGAGLVALIYAGLLMILVFCWREAD